ncbi:hypothetical protein [Nocardioides caldifontis]|uniref:hypothetical protein n=1 Tax=Nocardioides caldifontis TaxID=2588938 RepID=UPI0013967A9B|nr:hypothetical protein [Nocardioides caldifontis]
MATESTFATSAAASVGYTVLRWADKDTEAVIAGWQQWTAQDPATNWAVLHLSTASDRVMPKVIVYCLSGSDILRRALTGSEIAAISMYLRRWARTNASTTLSGSQLGGRCGQFWDDGESVSKVPRAVGPTVLRLKDDGGGRCDHPGHEGRARRGGRGGTADTSRPRHG